MFVKNSKKPTVKQFFVVQECVNKIKMKQSRDLIQMKNIVKATRMQHNHSSTNSIIKHAYKHILKSNFWLQNTIKLLVLLSAVQVTF